MGQVTAGHVGVGHSVGGVWEGGIGQVLGAGQVGHGLHVEQVGIGGQVRGGGIVYRAELHFHECFLPLGSELQSQLACVK